MPDLRIVFMGTPELARVSLAALIQQPDSSVVGVVTQPDRPKGRNLQPHPSPVKELALAAGLPVLQPERARNEVFINELRALRPDLIVVAAYGCILPPAILEMPRWSCLNVHTSLLPKYRGAAPIQWAILGGETETGVTIMRMDPGLDTGDILTKQSTPISSADDSGTLHDRLAQIGAMLLVSTIRDYVTGRVTPVPQPAEGISHARKITKVDGRLDWSQPATVLWNRIRAFTPWPGAFTHLPGASRTTLLKVWRAEIADRSGAPGEILRLEKTELLVACGQQSLRLLEVQPEGKRRMTAREFLAGHGSLLGGAVI